MQTAQQLQTVTNCNKVSAYELQTALIRGGLAQLEVNTTAGLVLLYLASCYNGKAVYPKIKTISENIGISESGVKKAIAELVQKNCILKSKRHNGNNANIYTITNKVLSTVTLGTNQSTERVLSCKKSNNRKLNKKISSRIRTTNTIKSDDDLTSNSNSNKTKHVTLNDVPQHIRESKKILNPCAYWASLNEEEKKQQLDKAREIERKKLISLEKIKKLKEEKAREVEEEKKREEELNKPLNEQFSRNQAIKMVWQLRNLHKGNLKPGLVKSLVELYNLDIVSICSMSEGEIERYLQ